MAETTTPEDAANAEETTTAEDAPNAAETANADEPEMIYVDIFGNAVSADDPAAQTKYRADALERLRAGGFFPKDPSAAAEPGDEPTAEKPAAEEPPATPVLNSGVAQAPKPPAKSTKK